MVPQGLKFELLPTDTLVVADLPGAGIFLKVITGRLSVE